MASPCVPIGMRRPGGTRLKKEGDMRLEEAFNALPNGLRPYLREVYNQGGRMAWELLRRDEMDPPRALMAGLAMTPDGREEFEGALDRYAAQDEPLPQTWDEVIIGGGAHAAIWAATRRSGGGPRPLVLEKSRRFGGTFAVTKASSFFLNSRNRPGPIGAAGSRDALNVIPGAPMQPSDMSGAEYQANADVGLVVRCTLALNAVVRQATVGAITRNGDSLVVETNRGFVRARRVVIATGIGRPLRFIGTAYDNERLLSFGMFMRRFDQSMFPLRNLGRVAVVGGGDSGRTAVEALTGYGPYLGGSVASLDYVPRIDWYGVGTEMTKERWLECNRTRYKPLAALFQNTNGTVQNARVTGRERVGSIFKTLDGVQINGSSYDTAIVCIGFKTDLSERVLIDPALLFDFYRSGNLTDRPDKGALLGKVSDDRSFVVVGPAADLPFESRSDPEPRIEQNRVALFRLAPRTATLASMLPITPNQL
jgi:hypothetical protein